ncbi:MAG: membrane protein insertase YidC, partial [Sphaerotilus sp.]|nr:membrane protein insertase YidC [Sphaerotilus sp.]
MTGMTDTRRAVLWGVFSVSLVMLWDGWSKHNGQPSMFAPPPPAVTAPAQAGAAGVPAVAGAASAAVAGVAALPAATAGVPVSQKIDITTDLVQATFDTRGGSIVRMALPRYKDDQDAKNPVMLFDQSAGRVYQADSGLIPRMAGEAALPNHLTVMNLLPGPRTLADGQNELTLTFESPDQGGVKLRKSYTFKRGDYAVKVRHEVVNGTAAPIAPQLYLQLARDGTVPSSSMFMGPTAFTGPSIYTDKGKFQKVDFSDIEKGKADHEKSADNGWIAMVQHHFVGAWLVGDKRERSFQTKREGTNLYSTSMTLPLAPIAAGATQAVDATLYAGPQEEK